MNMPDKLEASDAYDLARDKAEAALEAYARDDKTKGDELIEQARGLDPDAVRDVMAEFEEDASAEHDPEALNRKLDPRPE